MKDYITKLMFAVPLGTTTISQEICDKLKPLKGIVQSDPKDYDFDVLKDNPEVKKELTDIFTIWVSDILNVKSRWIMTTNWITQNFTGKEMRRHKHFNSAWSAVLYFDKIDQQHAPLCFENPLTSFTTIEPFDYHAEKNLFNSDEYPVPLEERRIIFFPSYLMHKHQAYTPTVLPRKSFACNFFPIGKYGCLDSSLDTNWLAYD
jgi:hypothetical protein